MAQKNSGGQPSDCRKAKKMGKKVVEDFGKTTLRIYKLETVKKYGMKNMETLNRLLNRLLEEEILHNADPELVKEYFEGD